jgi:hypothetical protein
MAGITLAQAEARLAAWLEADAAVSRGQAHTIDGHQLTRADAAQIRENITFWDNKVKSLSDGGSGSTGRARVRYGVLDR